MPEETLPNPENQNLASQGQALQSESQTVVNQKTPHKFPILKFGLVLIFIAFSLVLLGGGYYLGKESILKQLNPGPPASPPPPDEPKYDPTADWKTYEGNGFSVKYDPTWQANADNDFGVTSIYDQNSWEEKVGNGGSKVGKPAKYFTVQIKNSTQSVKQFVDQAIKGPEYNGGNAERQIVSVGVLTGEIYKSGGEGSDGYIIVFTNGDGKIATINIPYSSPSENETIYNMLSTFKFTDSKTSLISPAVTIINTSKKVIEPTSATKKSYPIGSTSGWKRVKNNGVSFMIPSDAKCNDDNACTQFNLSTSPYIPENISVTKYKGASRRVQLLGPSPYDCHYIYQDATFGNVSALLVAGDADWCQGGVGGIGVVLGDKFITYDNLDYNPSTKVISIAEDKATIISTLKLTN